MFKDQVYELLSPFLQPHLWRFPPIILPRKSNCESCTKKQNMEVAVETTMSNHTLDQNELRSRRSSKIGDVDTPVELKKLDAHFDNKTTAAHPTANTSHVSEQFGSDEVSVASDEAALGSDDWDYLKKAESSATPSLSESTTPVPEVEGQLANFGIVSTGIYRSAWPAPDSYGFIKDLKLKTVVYV